MPEPVICHHCAECGRPATAAAAQRKYFVYRHWQTGLPLSLFHSLPLSVSLSAYTLLFPTQLYSIIFLYKIIKFVLLWLQIVKCLGAAFNIKATSRQH